MPVSDQPVDTTTRLIERLERLRLPRVLRIKAHIEGGAPLEPFDADFLGDVLADAEQVKTLAAGRADLHALYQRVVALHDGIMARALENGSAHAGDAPTLGVAPDTEAPAMFKRWSGSTA